MKTSNGVIFLKDWNPLINCLSPTDKACFWDLFSEYEYGTVATCDNPVVAPIWNFIKSQLDGMKERYDNKSQKGKEFGSMGGRPKKNQENPTEPKETLPNPTKGYETLPNTTEPNERVQNHNNNNNNNNNNNSNANNTPNGVVDAAASTAKQKSAYQEILKQNQGKPEGEVYLAIKKFIEDHNPSIVDPYADVWNMVALKYGLAQVKNFTDTRKNKIKTRAREPAFDFFKCLECIRRFSDFRGDAKSGWKVSFDYLIENQNNYTRMIERLTAG